MATRLSAHFVDLVYDAALKSFWRKKKLAALLRRCGISSNFLSTWEPEETKRDFLDRVFVRIEESTKRDVFLMRLAEELSAQSSFPDLETFEDSRLRISEATLAVHRLKDSFANLQQQKQSRIAKEEARKRAQERREEKIRSSQTLEKLRDRLEELSGNVGSSQTGHEFESWFYDLADFFDVDNRRPYKHQGREIDGALTVAGTTYLVELKFTKGLVGSKAIDSLRAKVHDKADNTMGIAVSIAGFTSVALEEASGPRTLLLTMDFRHLYYLLSGSMALKDMVERLRRHASQTGQSYLPPEQFG